MRIVSLVPSRKSQATDDYDTTILTKPPRPPQAKKGRSSSTQLILHPISKSRSSAGEVAEDRHQDEGRRQSGTESRHSGSQNRRSGKSRREGLGPPQKEFPAPTQSRPTSKLEDEDYSKRCPTSIRTYPTHQRKTGTRRYPKEKWVATPPELLRAESDGGIVSAASSADDYLKNCSRYGKYQVDKHSLVVLNKGEEEGRYGAWSPPLLSGSNSSDSGIALWRSEDEDGGRASEPDWDMTMDRALAVSVIPTSPDDDATLTSMEMVKFDGSKVQVLTDDQRFDRVMALRSASYPSTMCPSNANPGTVKTEQGNKVSASAKKSIKSASTRRKDKKKQKAAKKMKANRNNGDKRTRSEKPSPTRKPNVYEQTFLREGEDTGRTFSTLSNSVPFPTMAGHLSRKKKGGRASRRDSFPEDDSDYEDEDSLSRGRQRRSTNKRTTRRSSRSSRGSSSRSSSGADINPYDYESEYSDWDTDDYLNNDDLSCASSGSLPTVAQMEFRERKREEHRRWLEQRRKGRARSNVVEGGTLDSDDWEDYEEEDRIKALKVKSRRAKDQASASKAGRSSKGGSSSKRSGTRNLFGFLKRDKANKKPEAILEETASSEQKQEPLPWEEPQKSQEKGFFKRAAGKVLPLNGVVVKTTVDDLPFPKSDSMDGSLLDQDKYGFVFDELPVLLPAAPALQTPTTVAQSAASVSTQSHTLPSQRRRPLMRAKKGLGNRIKEIFLNPF